MSERYYFDVRTLFEEVNDARMKAERFDELQTMKLNRLKALCGRLPEPSEAFFIETQKSFSAFTFIVYLMRTAGRIRHLYIATYSTNERIINALLRWRSQCLIGSIHLHVSETMQYRMPAVWSRLQALHQDGVLRLTSAWSHQKVACIDTEIGRFVVEGSGNYGENAMQENYVFLRSDSVFRFRAGLDG